MSDRIESTAATAPKEDVISFVTIFVAGFVILFVIAACAQLFARPWRSWLPGAEGQKSLFGGVRSSVYTFMSYLT